MVQNKPICIHVLNSPADLPINYVAPEEKVVLSREHLKQAIRKQTTMIHLTRLNKQPLTLNSDLIKFIEYAPDTVITLVNGEKIVVLETGEAILDKIVEFRRRIIGV
jgi:uncharacterized protein YlzI (FlbEa/FlbD family)